MKLTDGCFSCNTAQGKQFHSTFQSAEWCGERPNLFVIPLGTNPEKGGTHQ